MCNLCSNESAKQQAARDEAGFTASRLERIAALYRDMASGAINPHSDEVRNMVPTINAVIRELVSEWV